jgi:hypothetical protein
MFQELIEENDWEGETWSFWIPVKGNEDEIERLTTLLKDFDDNGYSMGDTATASEINVLIKHSKDECSYMERHNKLEGLLRLPDKPGAEIVESLYKGGVCDMMKKPAKKRSPKAKKKAGSR